MRRLMLALGAMAALGGCEGSTISNTYYASLYSPGEVRLAAANNPALAVIRNNPFPNDTDNAGVLAAMQNANFGPKITFGQTPRPDDRFGYKVILDFGPSTYDSSNACENTPTPLAAKSPPKGTLHVGATFCLDKNLLSEAAGSMEAVPGPNDPRFHRLIGDLMVALTPPYDPKRVGDHCRVFRC